METLATAIAVIATLVFAGVLLVVAYRRASAVLSVPGTILSVALWGAWGTECWPPSGPWRRPWRLPWLRSSRTCFQPCPSRSSRASAAGLGRPGRDPQSCS